MAKSSHFLWPPKSSPYPWVVLRPYRAVVCPGLVFANYGLVEDLYTALPELSAELDKLAR